MRRKHKLILFLLFLIVCFGAGVGIGRLYGNSEYEKPEQGNEASGVDTPAPVIEVLANSLFLGAEDNKLLFCSGESTVSYPCKPDQIIVAATLSEFDIADIEITDGIISKICAKQEKISGKVLEISSDYIELEGYGRLPLAQGFHCYSLLDTIEEVSSGNIVIGYSYADYIVEDGRICAALIVRDGVPVNVRILLSNNADGSRLQQSVTVSSDCELLVKRGEVSEVYPAGEKVVFTAAESFETTDRIILTPAALTGHITIHSLEKSRGVPSYYGSVELACHEGGIALVNELDIEMYLLNVVPSEMPSYYHEEALKAQAICARTYAYTHILHAGKPGYGAHMDDTATFQVYNNIKSAPECTKAVKETKGQILLTQQGTPAETFYYSTSCGVGTDSKIWKTNAGRSIDYLNTFSISKESKGEPVYPQKELSGEASFREFITSENREDYEYEDGFYRWTYKVSAVNPELLLSKLQARYASSPKLVLTKVGDTFESREITEPGDIVNISVTGRGTNGVADEVLIQGTRATYAVISEGAIRSVLSDDETTVLLKNGNKYACKSLLPSGFFVIDCDIVDDVVAGYTLTGGGFGHGAGMSQNGARRMAMDGWTAEEILAFFYRHCTVTVMYK